MESEGSRVERGQLTEKATRALLALYQIAGGRAGVMVPHESIAAHLGWSTAETAFHIATIPLAYAVDGYRRSSLTTAGAGLASELSGQPPPNR